MPRGKKLFFVVLDNSIAYCCIQFGVSMLEGKHPFPFRIRQLSPSRPMVVYS